MRELQVALSWQQSGFSLDIQGVLPLDGVSVIYGASGSGKTTLLRCLAGLEPQAKGRLTWCDTAAGAPEMWQDSAHGHFVAAHQRGLGYVFQEGCLFEHLSVQGNLDFALKRNAHRPGLHQNLQEVIELLGIGHLLTRTAHRLSGGERQRVAIARALAARPRILLMDEPLSSLDEDRKNDILPWLEKLRKTLTLPIVYVTHASQEAMTLGDTLWVMAQGRLQASGPIMDVLAQSAHEGLGWDHAKNLWVGQVDHIDTQWHLAQVACGPVKLWVRDQDFQVGQSVRVLIHAQDVSLTQHEPTATSIQNHFAVQVVSIQPDVHPSQVLVQLSAGDQRLRARVTARAAFEMALAPGMSLWAQVKSVALIR